MAGRSWDDPWRHYPESRPIPADGIVTSKQRGKMADRWWSQRFVALLDSYGLGTRMTRGRRYARQGQVLTLEVTPGLLAAQVQGSRPTPYLVTVRAPVVGEGAWSALEETVRAKVGFAARLLAGEVPAELEEACGDAGFDLFPGHWQRLTATCSCPDWESPCKHLAASLYVFADQLDEDPWLLLRWRGRERDDLLAHLREDEVPGSTVAPWWPLVPGTDDLDGHRWHPPSVTPPARADGVLDRLPAIEATHADVPMVDHLRPLYPRLTDPTAAGS